MPCQGTAGAVVTRSIAHAHPAGTVSATGLEVSERAGFGGGAASAYERATVDSVQLTSELEVTSAVAKAHVVKDSSGYHTDVDGTSTGLVVYNGDPVKIPDSGVVRIPGVAKIESGLVTRSARGISVTALRVTLLSGDGAVVEIAKASVSMAPSGR
jgi:hypothetical protein